MKKSTLREFFLDFWIFNAKQFLLTTIECCSPKQLVLSTFHVVGFPCCYSSKHVYTVPGGLVILDECNNTAAMLPVTHLSTSLTDPWTQQEEEKKTITITHSLLYMRLATLSCINSPPPPLNILQDSTHAVASIQPPLVVYTSFTRTFDVTLGAPEVVDSLVWSAIVSVGKTHLCNVTKYTCREKRIKMA